jgi:TRAP-type C4-dicarboxylate transport system substrate-binding protein
MEKLPMNTPRKIRWLIAHQPQELFVRTARAFSEELNKTCAGELEVEILTYPEYRKKYNAIPNLDILGQADVDLNEAVKSFWKALFDSDVEMSQIQVGQVGELYSDFHALDLPFIFDDHDHVSETLEGPIGQELCQNLGQRSGVTGLAFTYSGGYRVIGSDEPILTLEELQNKRIVVQNPITLGTTIESMGGKAIPVQPNLWNKYDLLGKGEADAVETTYLRFNGKHILKTNHSMFMTAIVVSNKFWNSLTEQQQQAFRDAALAASRKEREWSVQDAEKFEQQAQENGVTITEISDEDTQSLKRKSQITYVKTKYYFTPDLIKRIRETRH